MTDALLDRLRARDWRITPQRRVVAEVLDGPHTHMTADEVLAAARGRLPEISLATVYNTLGEMVSMGEVLEVRAAEGSVRFDPNVGSHHHLVCTSCGALYDVHPEAVAALRLPARERHGFASVTSVEVVFRGLCAICAA